MSARADLFAVSGQGQDYVMTVVLRDRLVARKTRIPDLSDFAYRFRVRSEIDDSVVIQKSVTSSATLYDYTEREGNPTARSSFVLTLSDDDLSVDFKRPALARTIPYRSLPYTFVVIDGDDNEEELLHGYVHIRGNIAKGAAA